MTDTDTAVLGAPTLVVRGVGKSFGDRVALKDVSFEVERGELMAVIGPNGAGKTTLLTILAGIREPDGGTVQQQGPNADKRIGWVPQQTAVYQKLTVAQNLRLFARLEKVSDLEETSSGCSTRRRWPSAPTTSSAACRAATASA